MQYLFEISTEVCRAQSGLAMALAGKAVQALAAFGDGYVLIGRDGSRVDGFIETSSPFWEAAAPHLKAARFECRFGRWNVQGSPQVLLVRPIYEGIDTEDLLYHYWKEFQVDSYEGSPEYVENVVFSTVAGMVIELVSRYCFKDHDQAAVHAHEWKTAATLLYLKKRCPNLATIFTSHGTALGREALYAEPHLLKSLDTVNFDEKALQYGVRPQHSLEKVIAAQADSVTAVSESTAMESYHILGRYPDAVIPNGLNLAGFVPPTAATRAAKRKQLLDICSAMLNESLSPGIQIWLTSGNPHLENKGLNIIVRALNQLDTVIRTQPDTPDVTMLFLLRRHDPDDYFVHPQKQAESYKHMINSLCQRFNLKQAASRVRVLCSDELLNSVTNAFGMTYQDILTATDLTMFPSYYQPWGYPVLESLLYGVPTITTDLAGVGQWIDSLEIRMGHAVHVLRRAGVPDDEAVQRLATYLLSFLKLSEPEKRRIWEDARTLINLSDWALHFPAYRAVYVQSMGKAYERFVFLRQTDPVSSPALAGTEDRTRYLIFTFFVDFLLPARLNGLKDMAYNLWWSWNEEGRQLFQSINPVLWESGGHNPVKLLRSLPYAQFEKMVQDDIFMDRYRLAEKKFHRYMNEKPVQGGAYVAYFSMEYGIHESLPIYSGGLGVLAGDHLKEASDQNVPLVAVGLFFKSGYFVQEINRHGDQVEHFPVYDWKQLPLKILMDDNGEAAKVKIELPGRDLRARIFVAMVGRTPLYLLDADVPENHPEDRSLTEKLYNANTRVRVIQEMLLGIGGVRLLKDILGIVPAVYHMNEGHSAFLVLERIRRQLQQGQSFEEACRFVTSNTVFTTHTPVPAGNEIFSWGVLRELCATYFAHLGVSFDRFLELGASREVPDGFSMTLFALRLSKIANAVSKLHRDVAYEMWAPFFKESNRPFDITYVTNGVHVPSWMGPSIRTLAVRPDQRSTEGGGTPPVMTPGTLEKTDDSLLWAKHSEQKKALIHFLQSAIKAYYVRIGLGGNVLRDTLQKLDAGDLFLGFARRFAEYKRATLIFQDVPRLKSILCHPQKPVMLIFAGKAHPADMSAKRLIKRIMELIHSNVFEGRLILLENYSIAAARFLVQGTDGWLNMPVFRHEACGTSGMKAAINGSLNISIPDGWWYEAPYQEMGWMVPPSESLDRTDPAAANSEEVNRLLQILENEVAPMYYNRDKSGLSPEWIKKMKASIDIGVRQFGAQRMIHDYVENIYWKVPQTANAPLGLRGSTP